MSKKKVAILVLVIRFFAHILVITLLTIITQIGGLIWLISWPILRKWYPQQRWRRLAVCSLIYLVVTLGLIPIVAPLLGRVALPKWGSIVPQTYFTVLANRHYVRPSVLSALENATKDFRGQYPDVKVVYLDANFPFYDGFPLLPHLSHSDGKKLDLSFIYQRDGELVNTKPATSGYGAYAGPKKDEYNQTTNCLKAGHWQYDFSKYLSFGVDHNLELAEKPTKQLLNVLLAQPATQKILLEPHLRQRLGLPKSKVRFQGCHSVRHDDHLHWQVQ
ncbi:MAG: hypothetical protein AAFU67_09705 [Bacteroidota bacterium]